MIVTIAAGQQASFDFNPLVPVQTLTSYIVQVSLGDAQPGTLEYQTAIVIGMTLFLLTLVLNLIAKRLNGRFREAFQ